MTALAERVLRDVLTEDAARAPLPPGDLTGRAHTDLRRRRIRNAAAAFAVVAVAGGAVTQLPLREQTGPTSGRGHQSPYGARWQLVGYRKDGTSAFYAETPVQFRPYGPFMLSIIGGTFSARGCDTFVGDAKVDEDHITLVVQDGVESARCVDASGDDLFREFSSRPLEAEIPLTWDVDAGPTLRLTAPDGDYLEFEEREKQ